jgi:phosphomannomutase
MIDFKPEIFRAYDIRGKYPHEINEKVAFFLGLSFGEFLRKKTKKRNLRIGLGRDGRQSSLPLSRSFLKGLSRKGVIVYDLGLCTSPMVYWASHYFSFDGAIQITASHLSEEFNGFKLLGPKGIFLGQNSGLENLKKIFLEKIKKESLKKIPSLKKGKLIKKEILSDYINFQLQGFDQKFENLKVVVDFGNTVCAILLPFFKKISGIKIFPLFSEILGSFPYRGPDPTKKENLLFLMKEVKKRKADFGLAFDGDGDRVCFVNEKGKEIVPNLIFSLLIKKILQENPGAKIVHDVKANYIVRETILKYGGLPIVSPVGHTFIKKIMKEKRALFGGESSAHYYYQRDFYCESPLFVFLKICQILSEEKKPLSFILKPFDLYYSQDFTLPLQKNFFSLLEKKYARKGKVERIDGLKIDFGSWWFLARPSNTEPIIRFFLEAKEKKLFLEKKKEILSLLKTL